MYVSVTQLNLLILSLFITLTNTKYYSTCLYCTIMSWFCIWFEHYCFVTKTPKLFWESHLSTNTIGSKHSLWQWLWNFGFDNVHHRIDNEIPIRDRGRSDRVTRDAVSPTDVAIKLQTSSPFVTLLIFVPLSEFAHTANLFHDYHKLTLAYRYEFNQFTSRL